MGLLSHCVTALFRTHRVGGLTLVLGACFSVCDKKGLIVGSFLKIVSRSSYDASSRQQQTAPLNFFLPWSSYDASGLSPAVKVNLKSFLPRRGS